MIRARVCELSFIFTHKPLVMRAFLRQVLPSGGDNWNIQQQAEKLFTHEKHRSIGSSNSSKNKLLLIAK